MDSIGDVLVRINNALKVKKETVDLPHSKMKEGIGKILLEEGYISKCEVMTRLNKKYLRLGLKYTGDNKSIIEGMRRISTPGRRIYVGVQKIPRVQSGFGTAILSTPKGLMTDEGARASKIGGEVICYVW
jgi:small subunit ribosomal protein S8